MLDNFHDFITVTVAAMCLWAIVSPSVPTRVLPTAGLAVIGIAAIWSLDYWMPATLVVDTMLGGMGLIGAGVLWRVWLRRRRPVPMRRQTDWMDTPSPETRPHELGRDDMAEPPRAP